MVKLFDVRAKFTITQHHANQFKKAIEVLVDKRIPDDIALKVVEDICNAKIGP